MKIAIIGASIGQIDICKKAKEMGLETIAFAWEKGAVCKSLVDKFYPISIFEKDAIVEVCQKEQVEGVVTNASDQTVLVSSYVSEKLGLNGNSYDLIAKILDKSYCRKISQKVSELSEVEQYLYDEQIPFPKFLPCIVKPISGGGKVGVSFANSISSFKDAIEYSKKVSDAQIVVERYIEGREVSVETLSFNGKHNVIQITDKESSGPPHFVELSHHQPSSLKQSIKDRIGKAAFSLLKALQFKNGPAHIEMKVDNNDRLYLIELNPRGGGDCISSKLVPLSTGYDFLKGIINVSLNCFVPSKISNQSYSGIYFLCKQTESRLSFFLNANSQPWLVEKHIDNYDLVESIGNSSRNGYIIYNYSRRVLPEDAVF